MSTLQQDKKSDSSLQSNSKAKQAIEQDVAKVFMSGNSQAVRLPRAYRFDHSIEQLEIKKVGDSLILTPRDNASNSWAKRVDDWFCLRNESDIEVPDDPIDEERSGLADLAFHKDWFE